MLSNLSCSIRGWKSVKIGIVERNWRSWASVLGSIVDSLSLSEDIVGAADF